MSKIMRYVRLIIPAVVAILFAPAALAAACNSNATGSWGTIATWSCGHVPTTADTVTIATGHTVTVNVATANVLSVTVNNGAILTQSFALSSAGVLTVAGTLNSTNSMTIGGATNVTGILNITAATGTHTFTGAVIITGGTWNNSGNEAVTFSGGITNDGTFTGGTGTQTFSTTQAIAGGSPINFGGIVAVANGVTVTNNNTNVVTIAGNLTGGNATSTWVNNTNSTLNYGGVAAPMGTRVFTATAAGNTVNYTLAGAQTVKATIYNNLTLSGSGAKTTTGVTVNGILSMEGTATASVAPTYGAAATLQYNTATARTSGVEWITPFAATGGVIIANTGVITLNAAKVFNASVPLTINAGATLATGNFQLTFGGDFINNGGTFTAGSSPIVIANTMAAQSIDSFTTTGLVSMTKTAGTATFTGNVNAAGLTISGTGGTLDLGAGLTHTFTGAWTRTNGTLNGGSSTLNIGGSCSGAGGTFTAGTGTVNWNAAGPQTVCPVAYNNLNLSGSGVKTMTGVTTIGGNLSMSGTATATAAAALTVGGNFTIGATNTFANGANALNVAGNFAQDGTFTAGAGVVTLNGGAAVQTISGVGTLGFANLTVSNAGVTLARNVTVTSAIIGTVTLTNTCPTDYTLTSNSGAMVQHSCPTVVNSINRADSSPSSAATVRWTVIFNQSVTGVDATAFTLAASGVSGAYITAVTGSGTTWTVTANTGIGSGTLGLNQTGPGSVVPPLNGTFTGQVYTITSTPALAEYRMDEASWNGTANEVVNTSGGYPGTAAGLTTKPTTSNTSPAIAGSPGTCRYGVFNRSNKDYLALAGFPNLAAAAGDFTITAWINVADNTLPGQRIFIDDETNTSPGGWGFSVGETTAFGVGGLRFYYRQPSVYILDTVPIPSNQWLFVALSVQLAAGANASSATIYAWNTAGTLVTSNTGTFTWVAGSDPGPSSIGGETNASGEGTNVFGFGGNIDEVRVYQKVLSQAALTALAAQTHVCPINIPDHLEIHSSGTGVTCTPSTLTVVACADAACTTPYTLGVTGTLSATGTPTVNWDGTTGGAVGAGFDILVGGSSVTKNVQVTTPGSVVFGISAAAPAPVNPTTCNFGSPSCTFTAADTGFFVSAPDHVAETASTLTVQAVKKADNSLACVPAFQSVSKTVNLKCAYVNPATGTLPVRVRGAALNATNNAAAACDGSGGNISLSFNASGIATPSLQYADVGSMRIDASYAGAGLDAGLSMTGSGTFIAAPAAFAFSGITPGSIKAGNDFSATVTAKNNAGNTVPNFGHEGEGVTLTSALVSPLGGANPTLANGSIAGGTFSNGAAAVANLSWGEVGNITLNAALTSASYLGSGLTATGTSATVGVFIPDHFDTSVVPTATLPMPCPTGLTCPALYNGFVYSGQPFSVQVIARNLAGSTTANYDGALGFSKTVTLTAWDALGSSVTQNPGSGVLGGNSVLPAAFASGEATLTDIPAYTFSTSLTAPTDIYVRAADADASSRRTVPATSVEGGVKVVSGRIKIGNAHGSELLPLPMTATVQYYSGTYWATSATDDVTSFNTALSTSGGNLVAAIVSGLGGGITVSSPGIAAVTAGVRSFRFSAPGVGGSADISLNAPPYLPSNTARATFGVYKGTNEFIYMRESY